LWGKVIILFQIRLRGNMAETLPRSLLTPLRIRVLWALLRYPHLSASEIADVVQCRPSTVYTVMRTLSYHGALESIYMPSPDFLGVELIGLHLIPRSLLGRERERAHLLELLEGLPWVVHATMLDGGTILVSMTRDFAQLKKCIFTVRAFARRTGLWSPEDITTLIFPREASETAGLFSFHRAVEKLLFRPPPEEHRTEWRCSLSMEDLSWNDLTTLSGLLSFPSLSDSQLANLLKMGRRKVSRTRQKLLQEGAIRPLRVPKVSMLPVSSILLILARDPTLRRSGEMAELLRAIEGSSPFMSCWNHFGAFSISTTRGDEDTLRTLLAGLERGESGWISVSSTVPGRVENLRGPEFLPLLEELIRERFFGR